MSKLGLSTEEDNQLKTICEYLFFDEFKEYVSYSRFEQCFQPLFNNIPISMDKVFRNICGEKKKYINYKRFVNSYLLYKSNDPKIIPEVKTFFEKLFKSILKKEKSFVGKPQEKTFTFSTPKACKKREFISSIKLLSGEDGAIHGLIIEYDGVADIKMYPKNLEETLEISLDMELKIIDKTPIKEKKLGKLEGLKETFYKDAITHVFGTISEKTGFLTFLGFKCVSGKTVFVGYPEGDGFIFGRFGQKFHEIKIQASLGGIILLQPGFNENIRKNYYLSNEVNNLTNEDLKRDELIQDENLLSELKDAIQIDKMITTPIIEENHFFNNDLKDEIDGKNYKEVVNQNSREWIVKTSITQAQPAQGILTLDDALKEVEKEKENSKKILEKELNGPGEMTAKGRRRKKVKKDRKKNKLITTKKPAKKSKVDKINKKPIDFLKNKENYQKLKEQINQGIYDEISKIKGQFTTIGQSLIENAIPDKKTSIVQNTIPEVQKKDEKEKDKMEKLISKKGEVENNKSDQKSIVSNVVIMGDSDDTKDKNLFFTDAQQIINAVENINSGSSSIIEKCFTGAKIRVRAVRSTIPDENWRTFGTKIRKLSGIFLLQTIGSVLKGIRVLNDEIEGKKAISLEERIKLVQLLNDNESIVDFLGQEEKEDKKGESSSSNKKAESKEKEEEDFLVPSEKPEEITSLPELETKMGQIKKLLENKNLKPEDKKKLEQLQNLYLQQKNILIENVTNKVKEEIINKNKLNVDKYIQQEKEKRNKAMEKTKKEIEDQIRKEKGNIKGEISINIKNLNEIKTFKKQKIKEVNEPWKDPLFPPEKISLCPFIKNKWILPEDALEDDIKGWKEFNWCRIEEIFDSKNYSIFYEGIAVEDILQGGKIGDCYFLSVLGSLCKFPGLIEKLFYFKEKTKEHIYGIYFYINGNKKLVLIDDYVPYIGTDFKQFAMSKSEENEIWVALIEKAWAKVNGNYIRIGCGGSPNEVFDVLTEAYSEKVYLNNVNKDELWDKLIDGEKKGFVMTAGTSGSDDVLEVGLASGHAFTVLGIHEIKGERVIRLRNPWGEGEFSGDWSYYSSKWTEELKKEYNYKENEDGDFFIGYKDFLKYFVIMGFAKLHPEFTCTKLKIKKAQAIKCQLIKVTISQDNTLVYFQLYGKNPRIPNKKGEYPKTTLSNLILVDKYFNYIEANAGSNMHICVEATLKKGEYYLFCDANFRYNKDMENHGYRITAYSGINVPMENVTEKNPVPDLLRKVVIDYCKKKEKPNKQKNGVNVYVTQSFNKDLPYKVLTLENTSNNDYSAIVGIECKGDKNCCFYCDEAATENDTKVFKKLNGKQSIAIIIMYYNLSSLFNFNLIITDSKKEKDPIYNHPVFDEEGEAIDEKGELKQYFLEKDESYYIGIDNSSNSKYKLKLELEGLKIKDGPYKGQKAPVFELNINERKVFEVLSTNEDEISFRFDFG